MFSTNQGKHNSLNVHSHTNIFLYIVQAICQVYPSEYAYHDDSVNRAENPSANCRRYSGGPASQEQFILCDGTQLKLADSKFDQEPYSSSEYYQWSAGSDGQVLFIFDTRVSLTAITLHYYSDNNLRGLSELRFYAVPDDFEVWKAPTTSYSRVDVATVPPGGEPAGHRNISINVNFNTTTKKVMMYKCSSSFQLAVSEVQFFTCKQFREK